MDRIGPATTLKDIAKVAGVSAQTVSCAVNHTGSISEEVRTRVRQIAEQMGYSANKSAKAMRTGRSQTLGLVVSDMSNPFYPELAQAVERAAASAGYAMLLVDARAAAFETADRIVGLKSHPVDGIIATEYFPALDRLNLPTTIIGGPFKGRDCVYADDIAGGTFVAEHLIRHGHRRLGLITGPMKGCIPVRRRALYKRIEGEATVLWECFTDTEQVTDEIRSMLERTDHTAIVCSNDLLATRVLRALRDIGREVPRDVSVFGFDDIPWAAIVTPALTTVRQPFAALGANAVELVIARIMSPQRRTRRIQIDVSLVDRDSVASVARCGLNTLVRDNIEA